MKKLIGAALALFASVAFAATTVPVQLLNPTGSTAGQAIVSTGPSSAPGWAGVNAVTLNGATFASPGAIGSTTPGTGAFTTINASGAITPSQTAGIVGTTTNNNANAGSVGELISSIVTSGSAVSLTSGSPINITSITLTAGDWDIQGTAYFTGGTTTVGVYRSASVSQTTGVLDLTVPNYNITPDYSSTPFGASTGNTSGLGVITPITRKSLSTTTTFFLVVQCGFSTSTMSGYGIIRARRVR